MQLCSIRIATKLVPVNPPMRPNINMKQAAVARTFVGYEITDIPIIIAAHKLQLINITKAHTIK